MAGDGVAAVLIVITAAIVASIALETENGQLNRSFPFLLLPPLHEPEMNSEELSGQASVQQ